jgi:hypothetical protein
MSNLFQFHFFHLVNNTLLSGPKKKKKEEKKTLIGLDPSFLHFLACLFTALAADLYV